MGLPLDPDWAVREGAVREGAVRTHSLLGARDLGKQGAKGLPGLWNLQPPLLSGLSSCGLASTPPQTPSSHFPRAQEAPLVVQAEFIVFWAVLCVWAGAAPEGSSLWAPPCGPTCSLQPTLQAWRHRFTQGLLTGLWGQLFPTRTSKG